MAVALYGRGLQALQRHDYGQAAELLRSILVDYPEEKELHDRARLYLNVCERQTVLPRPSVPANVEERLYAATLALNAGEYARALSLAGGVIAEQPENDHAYYVMAVAQTLSGNVAEALPNLMRAIEINPGNRSLARQDSDFEVLRRDERFRQSLDLAPGMPRMERHRGSPRSRASR